MTTTTPRDTYYRRTWNPLADPTLPLREPDAGPWLVEGDLFGPAVDADPIDRAYAVMALSPDATFIVMTERPGHMAEHLTRPYGPNGSPWENNWLPEASRAMCRATKEAQRIRREMSGNPYLPCFLWPLRNIIPAVTLSTQRDADLLVPALLKVPAARRLAVLRPTQEIDLTRIGHGDQRGLDAITGEFRYYREDDGEPCSDWGPSLGWIALESLPAGPDAPDWIRSYPGLVRRWCQDAGVPLWCGPAIDGELIREWPEGVSHAVH